MKILQCPNCLTAGIAIHVYDDEYYYCDGCDTYIPKGKIIVAKRNGKKDKPKEEKK